MNVILRSLSCALVVLCAAAGASAQQAPPLGATVASLHRDATAGDTLTGTSDSPTRRVIRGAAVGGGIGVLVGVATAVVLVHTSTATDHSEDGLAYGMLSILGGLFGIVVGAIAGSLAHAGG